MARHENVDDGDFPGELCAGLAVCVTHCNNQMRFHVNLSRLRGQDLSCSVQFQDLALTLWRNQTGQSEAYDAYLRAIDIDELGGTKREFRAILHHTVRAQHFSPGECCVPEQLVQSIAETVVPRNNHIVPRSSHGGVDGLAFGDGREHITLVNDISGIDQDDIGALSLDSTHVADDIGYSAPPVRTGAQVIVHIVGVQKQNGVCGGICTQ